MLLTALLDGIGVEVTQPPDQILELYSWQSPKPVISPLIQGIHCFSSSKRGVDISAC